MNSIYKTDGNVVTLKPKGNKYTLQELQSAVGGYIETANAPNDNSIILIFDEEGMLKSLPINKAIAQLYNITLYGNVVLTSSDYFD